MKLPKQLAEEGLEDEIRSALEKNKVELYKGAGLLIPLLPLTEELRKHIFYARSVDELAIGYEVIEKTLNNELRGLKKTNNMSDRVSRLLFISNDGSHRFYRELEFLQNKHGNRVLICRIDADSKTMGSVLGLKGRSIKAIMVIRKRSLLNILQSVACK